MAVGKGSVARASMAAGEAPKKASGAGRGRSSAKAPEKGAATASATVAAPSEQVTEQIVYKKSSKAPGRDTKPGEVIGIGDDMPIYYY